MLQVLIKRGKWHKNTQGSNAGLFIGVWFLDGSLTRDFKKDESNCTKKFVNVGEENYNNIMFMKIPHEN